MATRITYRQVFVAATTNDADADDAASVVIPHVQGGWIQIFDQDYRGSGSGRSEYLLHVAVVEPVPDAD